MRREVGLGAKVIMFENKIGCQLTVKKRK